MTDLGSISCAQAAEFISTLCDGTTIPHEVAIHFNECDACKQRLHDYIQIGIELRLWASAFAPASVKPISWKDQERTNFGGWRIWMESMRIPRVAFALMLVVIAALSLRIATVHATGGRQWFLMHVWDENGSELAKTVTGFDPAGKKPDSIILMRVPQGAIGLNVVLLGESEGATNLGVRAIFFSENEDKSQAIGTGEEQRQKIRSAPMKEITCSAGEKTSLAVEGFGAIEIGAEVRDKVPQGSDPSKRTLFPPQGDLSVTGALVLLNGDKVAAKTDPVGGEIRAANSYFALRIPGHGRYVFASRAFAGAVEGQLNFNQVRFMLDGENYLLIAGAPIRSPLDQQQIWVRHDSESELQSSSGPNPTVDFGSLSGLAQNEKK